MTDLKGHIRGESEGMSVRQRWMLVPVVVTLIALLMYWVYFLATLSETRAFIGERGWQYCWIYRDFSTYVIAHLFELVPISALLSLLLLAAFKDNVKIYGLLWLIVIASAIARNVSGIGVC